MQEIPEKKEEEKERPHALCLPARSNELIFMHSPAAVTVASAVVVVCNTLSFLTLSPLNVDSCHRMRNCSTPWPNGESIPMMCTSYYGSHQTSQQSTIAIPEAIVVAQIITIILTTDPLMVDHSTETKGPVKHLTHFLKKKLMQEIRVYLLFHLNHPHLAVH